MVKNFITLLLIHTVVMVVLFLHIRQNEGTCRLIRILVF